MNSKGYSKQLNNQVQKLKNDISNKINENLNQQLQDFSRKESEKDIKRIKDAINTKIFDRLNLIDKRMNNKKITQEQRKKLIKELTVLIQPKTILDELNVVLTVKNTWIANDEFYKQVSKNSMFTTILKRYKADPKVFEFYQAGLLENTNDLLKSLEKHAQQLHSYNSLLQEIVAERGGKQFLNLGVGLVGTLLAGPVGGIVGRKISQSMTSDTDRINHAGGLVDKSWDKVHETFQLLLTSLENEYFNIHYSLYGGYTKRINEDLSSFGYEVKTFNADSKCFIFSVKPSEIKKVSEWLQDNLMLIEESFRQNQHSYSQDLFTKIETYVNSNIPFGEVLLDGKKVKDIIALTKYNYMVAFIEQEYWNKKKFSEALKQYILLLEKLPIQIVESTVFANIQLPSILVIISRMIHLSVSEFKEKKRTVYDSFHHYHSLQKKAKLSPIQIIKVFEIFEGFTSNKKRVSLKMSEVDFEILYSIYSRVIRDLGVSHDAFSRHLKNKLNRSNTKVKYLFNLSDCYKELFLRYKFIQPRYVISLLLAILAMSNWVSFASAGKFLPGTDGLYFNYIENKRIDTNLDEYALNKAVNAKDQSRILQLISLGANPDVILEEGRTLLEKAVLEGENLSYIESLLRYGADPNIRSSAIPLIFFAINTEDEELVALMLKYGAEPFEAGKNGYDSLDYVNSLASADEYYGITILLLEEYENIEGYAVEGSIIIKALAEKDSNTLEKIFDLGANANEQVDGKPILFHAIDSGASEETFKFLFDKGAKIDSTNAEGKNLLAYLTTYVQKPLSLYKYFLAEGVDINAQDLAGNSPLILAAIEDEQEIIRLLLESQADPNLQNESGSTALSYAFDSYQLNMIESLLPVSKISEEDYLKFLKDSVADMKSEFVTLLLELNSAPEISEENARELLFLSIDKNDTKTLTALLNYGVDPNFINGDQISPLEYAQEQELVSISEVLINNGTVQNLGYLTQLEGYWQTNSDSIAHFYQKDNQFILEEYSEGKSSTHVLSEKMEVVIDNEAYKMSITNNSGIEVSYDTMSFYNKDYSFDYRRIEENEFKTYLKEQEDNKKEKEAVVAQEKMEEEIREKEENKKIELVKAHEPLVGRWVTGEEGKDKEEIFIHTSGEDEEIFIVVEGLTYTYAVSLNMEDTTTEGNLIHFGDSDYYGTLQSENTLKFYQEVHNSTLTYKRVE